MLLLFKLGLKDSLASIDRGKNKTPFSPYIFYNSENLTIVFSLTYPILKFCQL